jgi:hypothetical protein
MNSNPLKTLLFDKLSLAGLKPANVKNNGNSIGIKYRPCTPSVTCPEAVRVDSTYKAKIVRSATDVLTVKSTNL